MERKAWAIIQMQVPRYPLLSCAMTWDISNLPLGVFPVPMWLHMAVYGFHPPRPNLVIVDYSHLRLKHLGGSAGTSPVVIFERKLTETCSKGSATAR